MKRLCLLLVLLMARPVVAANEIKVVAPEYSGQVLYMVVFNGSGEAWNGSTFVTYTTTQDTFDVALVETGTTGLFMGSIPGAAGERTCITYLRAGATAASSDPPVQMDRGYFDGATLGQAAVNGLASQSSVDSVPAAVRSNLATELGRIDAAVSTRLASASYVAPLDAAGTRSALGLAGADLTSHLDSIYLQAMAAKDTAEGLPNAAEIFAEFAGRGYSAALATKLDTNLDVPVSDAVSAAENIEAGTTEPRVNYPAAVAYQFDLVDMSDGTYKAIGRRSKKARLRPGEIKGAGIAVQVFTSRVFGATYVETVHDPVVISGGSITGAALGPRDSSGMIVLNGTATAGEERTVSWDMTMATGERFTVTIDVEVFDE